MSKSKPPIGKKPVRRSSRWNEVWENEAWRNADASIIPEYVPDPTPFTRAFKRIKESWKDHPGNTSRRN